jgi:hypothetical protein
MRVLNELCGPPVSWSWPALLYFIKCYNPNSWCSFVKWTSGQRLLNWCLDNFQSLMMPPNLCRFLYFWLTLSYVKCMAHTFYRNVGANSDLQEQAGWYNTKFSRPGFVHPCFSASYRMLKLLRPNGILSIFMLPGNMKRAGVAASHIGSVVET